MLLTGVCFTLLLLRRGVMLLAHNLQGVSACCHVELVAALNVVIAVVVANLLSVITLSAAQQATTLKTADQHHAVGVE